MRRMLPHLTSIVLVLAAPSANALMIDLFDDPTSQSLPSLVSGLSGVLGTTRGLGATVGAPFSASGGVSGGMLDLSFRAQAGSSGYAVASYEGVNSLDLLGGVDLTEGGEANRFALEILGITSTGPQPNLWFIVTDSDGTRAGATMALNGTGTAALAFADIVAGTGLFPSGGDGTLDLTSVDSIQIRLATSGGSFSVQADNLQTAPEAPLGALLALAFIGLWLRTRRGLTLSGGADTRAREWSSF